MAHSSGFQQLRYRELPEYPRLPHPYFEADQVDVAMDSVPFGRIRVHYRTVGDGPPLLLIHGLMTASYSWRYVLAGLGEHFRVIAVDLPGGGRSDGPVDRKYSGPALATWIGEFQRALGIEGCAVVGNSLGGCFVLRRALDDPSSFERVVLIHSPVLPEFRHRALRAVLAIPGVAAGLAAYVRRSPLRWAHYRTHYYDGTLKSLEEARIYGEPLARRDRSRTFVRYLQDALRPNDLRNTADRLRGLRDDNRPFPIPLMIMYGTAHDPIVSPSMGRALEELVPSAKSVWLDQASHFVHVDRPDAVTRELIGFLRD
ncbi:alpha/beta fold hydrolase [Nocardia sp. NPDC060256]|uniref:alpha/beta fold hydrolase n=1 Tax=unclassified Nocardia TaxID=2637762 RepID=UPI0036611EB8